MRNVMDDAPELLTLVARRLRQERAAAGLSQEELARLAEVTAMTVSRIERGIHWPSRTTLESLALALGIPATQLLTNGGEGEAA